MSTKPVALIIGVGPGLSQALVRRFAAGGYQVVGFGRDPSKSKTAVAQMTSEGLAVELKAVDAGEIVRLQSAIADTEAQHGAIGVLIYNAYRATLALPSQLDPAEAIADFNVNVAAPLAAARAVLPAMLTQGHGSIVFTGGGLSLDPTGWLQAASLAIGKAAIRSLAITLNKELSPEGIHVGTVTIAGQIQPGTRFSPERIADAYWDFVADAAAARPAELIFRG
jgi:NAD(P)-dependent dehydrogenase (short-subunit alcohol dehydrogenase family)